MIPRHLVPSVTLLIVTSGAFGQGSLTPPGPPAPTMKSLDQIEARKPIPGGSAPYTINAPGSYYLTGNLTVASGDAITVNAQNVTLDLNGFTVATTAESPSGAAILIGGPRVSVFNGIIYGPGNGGAAYSGGGFVYGINTSGSSAMGVAVHDLTITGCSNSGILLNGNGPTASRIERCMVDNTGVAGIVGSLVRECAVSSCAGTGITAEQVSDSSANAFGIGISARNAVDCSGIAFTGAGITCTGSARGCTGQSSNGTGLNAVTADSCQGTSNSGVGLNANNASTCMGTSSGTASGLNASTAANSEGTSVGGLGFYSVAASHCRGTSTSGIGLQVAIGSSCIGSTNTGAFGVYGNVLVGSQGGTTGIGLGVGLQGAYAVSSCLGISQRSDGLISPVVVGSYGQTFNNEFISATDGIRSVGTVAHSRGYTARPGQFSNAIEAFLEVGCTSENGALGTQHAYNMPP